ncbi:MAG TPA: alpha-L-arabinofuranosidase C-terminal domain-containing protein [Anaerolineales bacterium]|nr:alpha-L-arabinofuranosidase C-terminal domain-containing protein [Anaerolineales bacterium]
MTTSKAQILVDRNRTIAPISPLLFGGFAEHMGRCVYEGIYDPKSPYADEHGFRKDVLKALRDQAYTIVRYPGGNFLSGYNWLDGVGPTEQRPRVRDLAWQSLETNQFGTNEFMEFCKSISAAPMLGVNMGTGTIQSASDLVEYCNVPSGTRWSDLRVRHGFREPHNVRYWCVGNEMDGPWQIGHLDAVAYGNKALEAAKMMKWQDPTIKTVLCGSSGDGMPTYPDWDRTALEITWEHVDYLSMHGYVSNRENDTASYLANPVNFERFVDTLEGTLRYVKAKRRSKHDVYLSWDEWQVWYMLPPLQGNWTEAPHLAEELYNLEDALVVAQWLNLFLRKSHVIKIACVAQIVNTISWLHTRPDGILKHPSYYTFKLVSNLARGEALDLHVRAPEMETKQHGGVSMLDVSASYDAETGRGALFLVNRSQSESVVTDVIWQDGQALRIDNAWQLTGNDPKATNTWDDPERIIAKAIPAPEVEAGHLTLSLPPLSFTVLTTCVE